MFSGMGAAMSFGITNRRRAKMSLGDKYAVALTIGMLVFALAAWRGL